MRNNLQTMEWLERLYREEYPRLVSFATRRLDNEDMAQELVQETFMALLENAEELVFHANVRGWLMQTLKNKLLAHWKVGRTNLRRFVAYEEVPEQPEQLRPMEENITCLTQEQILQIAREQLSEEHYHHLIRLTVDGASHVVVAKEFGITVSASQKRLERTRAILKSALPEQRKIKKFKKICQLLLLTAIYR